MVLHVRKRELLCLPSFAAYSCLVTHDRGVATELKQDTEGRQYLSDSVSNEKNGKKRFSSCPLLWNTISYLSEITLY